MRGEPVILGLWSMVFGLWSLVKVGVVVFDQAHQ
jgi:hypothetical protein